MGINKRIIEIKSVCKSYGNAEVLKNVTLSLLPGEIHCLVGENGAGKTTLVKILTAIEQPSKGKILYNNQEVIVENINVATQRGIGVVYQHPVVFPDISVTENIFAGKQILVNKKWWPFINKKVMSERVHTLFSHMHISIDPNAKMASLSIGDRQLVEIAKALTNNIKVLVLDEPTASLSENGVISLFEILKELVSQNVAILYISHKIDEIYKIGHRVTVLRDGNVVDTKLVTEIKKEKLIELMVGRPLNNLYIKERNTINKEVMRVKNWGRRGIFSNIEFSVRQGEILGFSGLIGSGRTEVARTIIGIDQADSGRIWVDGIEIKPKSPGQMLNLGVAYVPEDRHGLGLLLNWPIYKNISLPVLEKLSKFINFLDNKRERSLADDYTKKLQIRPSDIDKLVSFLSGGNQQKVLLAKWLTINPKILILDDPTVGVDIGAKFEIYRIISSLAKSGIAIILISSDLPELLAMSDRILVFCDGSIAGAFSTEDATQESIMKAATSFGCLSNQES